MKIRAKLTLLFTLLVATILLIFSISIFVLNGVFRESDFFSRLRDRAITTGRLLINVEEVSSDLLKIIDKNTVALVDEVVMIYNQDHELLYTSSDSSSVIIEKEILSLTEREGEHRFKKGDREGIAILYTTGEKKFILIAMAYDKHGLKKIYFLKWVLMVGLLFSLLITYVAGWLFSGRVLHPMARVVERVKAISATSLNSRLPVGNSKDEIATLSITFNEMLERLEQSFELQKQFVANVSHEFRTPFAVVLSEIEYTLMREREKDVYKKLLADISRDIKNLNDLFGNLLNLAQASFDHSGIEYVPFRIDEVIYNCTSKIMGAHPSYKVRLDFQLPQDDQLITIKGSSHLMSIAIQNLMENSCKYSGDNTVFVKVYIQSGLIIEFIDNGIGIPIDQQSLIFEPFYRASNSRSFQGKGLGLSLVKKIVQMHKGEISINSMEGKGSVFTLRF